MMTKRVQAMSRTCTIFAFAALSLITAAAAVAGPLSPPLGPVVSTNKPLAEIEPRTAISDANTPGDADSLYRITAPGSYYLTGNIQGVQNKHGIEIASSGVTIDLNGFRLNGLVTSLAGIVNDGPRESITIVNGTVSAWGAEGIKLSTAGPGIKIERITAASNGASGIFASSNVTIRSCTAKSNALIGIYASSNATIEHCVATANGSFGIEAVSDSVIAHCSASGNTGYGFSVDYGGVITHCVARGNTGRGIGGFDSAAITACSAHENTDDGITVTIGGTIVDCSSGSNGGDGISAGSSCTVTNSTTRANTGNGIIASSSCAVFGCTSSFNTLDGIRAGSSSTVRENTCTFNGNGASIGAGIHITGGNARVEANTCISNDFGIDVDVAGTIIIRNNCSDNTQNFVIVADCIYGPIINRTAPASPAVIGNTAASTMGSTDPNANFAH